MLMPVYNYLATNFKSMLTNVLKVSESQFTPYCSLVFNSFICKIKNVLHYLFYKSYLDKGKTIPLQVRFNRIIAQGLSVSID